MLLNRDYVTYAARQVVKRLVESEMIETPSADELAMRLKQAMNEELLVEERLNDEVRQILDAHAEMVQEYRASYQEAFKKLKSQLAQKRKLILR